jgi:MFS family permease
VLTSSFPNNREQVLGYAETASGIGLLFGPILGGFIFDYFGGYLGSFLFFAGLEVILCVLNALLLP